MTKTEETRKRYQRPGIRSESIGPQVLLACPTGNGDGCPGGQQICLDLGGCILCSEECTPP